MTPLNVLLAVWLAVSLISRPSLHRAEEGETRSTGGVIRPAAPGENQVERDTLLITATTQGIYPLTKTGITLEIGYATVRDSAHLTITRRETAGGPEFLLSATDPFGAPLGRFEMPLVAVLPGGDATLIGWPGAFPALPQAQGVESVDAGRWLVVFDAHGLYAQPAWAALPDGILYLGPLEHYTPNLLRHDLTWGALSYAESAPIERAIVRRDGSRTSRLPTAAHSPRYADRFVPEDKSNPGGFMLLGWARADDLPAVARALRATIPPDPDLPAPGAPASPIPLLLPFDCSASWTVSWGYHHSTPQNRFAVDFAGALGQPVYAAHGGTVYLKRYGTAGHLIDVGIAARVVAQDGTTSTLYGHLDPAGTFARWEIEPDALPDFEWVEVGRAAPGQMIGVVGRTGYATGPHIHFVLWSWDQSLYQPVPLGPLTHFERGQPVPAVRRQDCDIYGR